MFFLIFPKNPNNFRSGKPQTGDLFETKAGTKLLPSIALIFFPSVPFLSRVHAQLFLASSLETRFAQKIAESFLEKCVKDLVPKEEAEADDEEGEQEV